jgi:hypothetical protein
MYYSQLLLNTYTKSKTMGGLLCCAGSALCCAGQALCACLCCPCRKAGVHAKNFAKIGYAIFQVLFMLIALSLMFSAKKIVNWFPKGMLNCP